MKYKSFYIFVTLLFISGLAFGYSTPGSGVFWNADSLVLHSGGAVTGGPKTFVISDDITISNGDTLVFLPGDTLIFNRQTGIHKIENYGVLWANSFTDKIVFTSSDQNYGDYTGFVLRNTQEGSQSFIGCIIEYAQKGIRAIDASPTIQSCTIRHTSDAAIDLTGSNAVIKNCNITHNQKYALKMTLSSSPLVEDNTFTQNNFQNTSPYVIITIGLQGVNSPIIRGNHIIGGYEKSGGISVWGQSQAVIEQNLIENCAYGIFCYQSGANPIIRDNILLNNNINPDTLYFGFGIACNGPNSPIITGNEIKGHFYGIALINGAQPNIGDLTNGSSNDDGGNRFLGNGIGPRKYELYNNNPLPIMAQGNWWGTDNPDSIEARIVHQPDNPAFGLVNYTPYWHNDPLPAKNNNQLTINDFVLEQNYPNPFNPSTVIPFYLPVSGRVVLEIFNILGQKQKTLVEQLLPAGRHTFLWDGTNNAGEAVSSGIYIYRLNYRGRTAAKTLLLNR
ncbi:MAG: hypothetical protein Kow0037_07010 [Calditrichia bacterium]